MKTVFGLKNLKKSLKKGIVTIGVFDGVHKGHMLIIKKLVKYAGRLKGEAAVLTFDPHPWHALHPKGHPPRIMSLAHKLRIFEELGVDLCIVIKFDRRFSRFTPERFIKKILVDKLNVSKVIVGENFSFGKGRAGTLATLRRFGKMYDFSVEDISPLKKGGRIISSSRIRVLISRGQLSLAQSLLGRPVSILGTVAHGYGRGRIIGFPTANIDPHHEVIPPRGVYHVKIMLHYKLFNGILNIGKCPTFESDRDVEPTVEVHIFNFNRDIYGRDLEILFVKKIRNERCFSSKENLIEQIKRDERRARRAIR